MTVTSPQGFRAAGIAAGIKDGGRLDLALVVNDGPGRAAAGMFTTNQVKAAPVLWSQQVLTGGALRAVVLNSGGANACTGPQGFQTTHATAEKAAEVLGSADDPWGPIEVAVCSTGLIGEQLPRELVLAGIEKAAAELGADGTPAATAVLTTDSRPKQVHVVREGWSVGGFAKGAGMLAPNMATMLVVLTTDAVADAPACDAALRAAVGSTFDRLDVDGGTSTNDTVLLLASGASGVTPSAAELAAAVTDACAGLCRELQDDAEGATKHVTISVTGARTGSDAVAIGRTVAQDNLCKTAFFGSDPNWGRIAMAVGRAPGEVVTDSLSITINGVPMCRDGVAAGDRHAADLSGVDILVQIELGLGEGAAQFLTTDLSHAYVEENSAYSS
ncbi:bifunctional glutamate N-acetyltransferase/amino-acid acetyltransferase ArgJ [Pseudonocardia sp.]|uniref:bifunctional glutamate N-acetyltransferase/amino-acid acetyltransferase ArgJ n=1 Tax=Pseudonocardia sp. TaxID=60912 RepID=UPI00261AAD70|nr:bifunctional glutamate N-acetyltransferase/amino-acid acetyltransferase ArgJ [Pseudonocardia sp.]